MKAFKYIKLGLLSLLAVVSLTSCLKEDPLFVDNGSSGIVELALPAKTTSTKYAVKSNTIALEDEIDLPVTINYTGANGTTEEVMVTLAIDEAATTEYINSLSDDSGISLLPSSYYEVPQSTVTIPRGGKTADFIITLKPGSFDLTKTYAIAVKIVSASSGTVSGNYGTGIFTLPVKSVWEGTYDYYVNNDYGTIDANIGEFSDTGIQLSTVGPNRVRVTGVWQTYSGWVEYQFNADNTSISSITAYSGSTLASKIDEITLIDPENGIFELKWTGLGRGVTEQWKRTGD